MMFYSSVSKKWFVCFVVLFLFQTISFCQDNIVFEEKLIRLGDISQGEKIRKTVNFQNNFDSTIVIVDVRVQCGCTAVKKTEQAIFSGETGSVEIEFDSADQEGIVRKTVTLILDNGLEFPFQFEVNVMNE